MEAKDSCTGEDLLRSHVADFEKHIIVSALRRTGGNQSAAAKQLGTTKRILMYRIHKYGIDIQAFRGTDSGKDEPGAASVDTKFNGAHPYGKI